MKAVEVLKKEGPKGFMARWKKGIQSITPEQHLKTQMIGYVGSIAGTIFAGLFFIFVYNAMWPIAIILLFNLFIQTSQFITTYQTYSAIKQVESENLLDILGVNKNESGSN